MTLNMKIGCVFRYTLYNLNRESQNKVIKLALVRDKMASLYWGMIPIGKTASKI